MGTKGHELARIVSEREDVWKLSEPLILNIINGCGIVVALVISVSVSRPTFCSEVCRGWKGEG